MDNCVIIRRNFLQSNELVHTLERSTGMSKKVLVISSSPRVGGNTDILCDEFAKGALESGNVVEKINLSGKKIGFCMACYACQGEGGRCPQKDDAAGIIEKMLDADVIVLGTPVYFYTMCAQLKALIDRSVMAYPRIQNKYFYYLMAMEDSDESNSTGTIEALRGFVKCCEGSEECGMVCGVGFFDKGEVKGSDVCRQSYELGKSV